MRRILALLLALLMVLALAACGDQAEPKETVEEVSDETETSEEIKETEEPEVIEDPEPSQGLDAYENPCDHPHEGMDLTVFNGTYRAKLPDTEDDETWLEIRAGNDFILLEHYGLMEGSVYRFWLEEFWPGEGWYTSTDSESVFGKSQPYSAMGQYENYSDLPQNRCITLTEDGIVLNYDDSDAEYYVRSDEFEGGHADKETLQSRLDESVVIGFDYIYDSEKIEGSWAYWTGLESAMMNFAEDGTFSMFRKIPGKPIMAYEGVYGFGENSGNLEIMAERLGHGGEPFYMNWEWFIDEYGDLTVSDHDGVVYEGDMIFWPVEEEFFTVLDAETALGYLTESFWQEGTYTDADGIEYFYYYALPSFLESDHEDLNAINDEICEIYEPLIQEELDAMDLGSFLSYDTILWESSVHNGVLFLHVFAQAFDWEEHNTYYVDVNTFEELTTSQMLERMDIDEDEFLEKARIRAEEIFCDMFSDMEEADREEYGYYDCLEQTVSDENITLDLPVYVETDGEICVYLRIHHMAGSGLAWEPSYIFDAFYPVYHEEAVG